MKAFNPFRFSLPAALCLFALCSPAHQAAAQCDNVTVTISPTASTCQSDGKITVTVSGADLVNLNMTTAQYSIASVSPGGYSTGGWVNPATRTATGGVLTGVPPGTYKVQMKAFCSTSNPEDPYTIKESNNQATVTGNYVVPNIYTGNVRNTFNCSGSPSVGQIPIIVSGGRAPYTITMTAKPAAYTGQTTFTMTSAGTQNIGNLPAGNYAFTVTDACTYNTSLTAAVGTFEADFTTSMVYDSPYMPGYTLDCSLIRLNVKNLSSSHELYSVYNSANYEVGLVYNSAAQPTTWQDLPSSSYFLEYTLPVDRDVFKKNGYYIAVWLRLKGTNCIFKARDVKAHSGSSVVRSYTPVDCDTVEVRHYIEGTSIYNFFCWPSRWCVVNPATTDTIIPWSAPVTTTEAITTRMPYGSQLVYRDAKGNVYRSPIQEPLIENIRMYGSYNISYGTLNADGYYLSSIYLAVGGGFPVGTRIQYLSGPPGVPAPNFPDITTTTATSYIYPYSSTDYTYISTPYTYLTVPGEYKFRVTLPNGCGTKDLTVTPYIYRLTSPLSVAGTQETCDGLRVYPQGGMIQYTTDGTTWYDYSSTWWYSIESAPLGVTVDKTGVQAGGYLLLPASGTYTLKLTDGKSTNESSYAARDTICIAYEKKPLSLDAGVTSAYVCAGGGGSASMRVKGENGSGNYTYQLMPQGGGTVIQQNTTGVFNYGSAGDTYTVRVIDNDCNTQFDQNVTILDLTDAQITYTSGSTQSNIFCEGQTLRVNCISLGSTSYSWTGPDGWTSTAQNPTRPNAKPSMSGRYTVTVTPEGCGAPMTQYVDVIVSPCMAIINPHLRTKVTN
jgi:hypothetical protein